MLWTAARDAQGCQASTEIRGGGVSGKLSCGSAGEFAFTDRLFRRASRAPGTIDAPRGGHCHLRDRDHFDWEGLCEHGKGIPVPQTDAATYRVAPVANSTTKH